MQTIDKFVTIRAKVFNNRGAVRCRCLVSPDGTVRVWDLVAKHYTTCHSLRQQAQERARTLAAEA